MCDARSRAAARAIDDGVRRLVRALPIVIDVVDVFVRYGVANAVYAARKTTASLDRYPLVRWLNRLTEQSDAAAAIGVLERAARQLRRACAARARR